VKSKALAPYQAHLIELTKYFTYVTYTYFPRKDNKFADILEKLASIINIPSSINSMPLCNIPTPS